MKKIMKWCIAMGVLSKGDFLLDTSIDELDSRREYCDDVKEVPFIWMYVEGRILGD